MPPIAWPGNRRRFASPSISPCRDPSRPAIGLPFQVADMKPAKGARRNRGFPPSRPT